jgi:glycosyltransferase involved in cell wall biosynthesis
MSAEDVTVVIPTRNRLALLREAVASVERQTLSQWRLVIVDDASEDGTWPWISQQFGAKVTGVRLEAQSERSVARNRGLLATNSAFVLFLDDDDALRPRAIEQLTAELAECPDAVAAVGGYSIFDEAGNRWLGVHPRRHLKRRIWPEAVFGWGVHTGRTLYRAQAVRDAGGFRPGLSYGEDRDLWLRISRLGSTVFVPGPVLDYRMHEGQLWPFDEEALQVEIARRHLAGLPEYERLFGERIVQARVHYDQGCAAWRDDRPRDALRSFVRMRRAPLTVLLSPLIWPQLADWVRHALAGALLGSRGVKVVRAAKSRVVSVRGRKVPQLRSPKRTETEGG